MPAISGVDILLAINTGTDAVPVYTEVGGQRGVSLKLDQEGIDTTSKDSSGWKEEIAGLNSWSIDFDALYIETDTGRDALEDALILKKLIKVQMQLPSGKFYEGSARVSSLSIDGPHNGEATASGSLTGTGSLTQPV